jgi:hypothetical protein
MGGYSSSKTRKVAVSELSTTHAQGGCDLQFRVDLVGIRSEISTILVSNDILEVILLSQDQARSVVCRKGTAVVGTLAAFRGLAKLIACLEQGHEFVAYVEAASSTRCTVLVQRAS